MSDETFFGMIFVCGTTFAGGYIISVGQIGSAALTASFSFTVQIKNC
jgi:hypothetical protein